MVNSYFSEWRTMKDPATVEGLLTSVFRELSERNRSLRNGERMGCSFRNRPPRSWPSEICHGPGRRVDEVLKDHYVGPLTKLGEVGPRPAASAVCVRKSASHSRGSRDNEWSLRLFAVDDGEAFCRI